MSCVLPCVRNPAMQPIVSQFASRKERSKQGHKRAADQVAQRFPEFSKGGQTWDELIPCKQNMEADLVLRMAQRNYGVHSLEEIKAARVQTGAPNDVELLQGKPRILNTRLHSHQVVYNLRSAHPATAEYAAAEVICKSNLAKHKKTKKCQRCLV